MHESYPFEVFSHDLVGFTIGRNFFPRSNSVMDLNGKGKLGGEEDAPLRECANSDPGKGGRIVLQSKKMMSELAQIKEEIIQIWITSMKMELS